MQPLVNLAVVGVAAPSLDEGHDVVLEDAFLLLDLLGCRQDYQLERSPEVFRDRASLALCPHDFELYLSPDGVLVGV